MNRSNLSPVLNRWFALTVALVVVPSFSIMASLSVAQSTRILSKAGETPRVLLLLSAYGISSRDVAAHTPSFVVGDGAHGAGTLGAIRDDGAALEQIRSGGWDFVALAGHPTFGKVLVIDGVNRVGDPSDFLHQGRMLLEEVRRAGARPVLLVPPRRPGAPAADQGTIDWAYHRLGREAGAVLAPVGDAFSGVRRRRPGLALFDPHGVDWSPAGTYLAVAVLEATVTGRPPGAAQASRSGNAARFDLPPETRQLLDEEAWRAVRNLAAVGGSREIPPPPFPDVPTLARGERTTVAALLGTWRGPLRLYPWPATLELTMDGAADGIRVTGRVRFDDGRQEVELEASDVSFQGHELSFRNPSDLAGGRTLYRLVSRGGHLSGVAELVTDSHGAYAIGSFELTRLEPVPTREAPER